MEATVFFFSIFLNSPMPQTSQPGNYGIPLKHCHTILILQTPINVASYAFSNRSVSCGEILQDKDYGRGKEELHPAWIKDREHVFLILEFREISRTKHLHKS